MYENEIVREKCAYGLLALALKATSGSSDLEECGTRILQEPERCAPEIAGILYSVAKTRHWALITR